MSFGPVVSIAARSPEILFERKTIALGISETCAIAEFSNDGRPDIFSDETWYKNAPGIGTRFGN